MFYMFDSYTVNKSSYMRGRYITQHKTHPHFTKSHNTENLKYYIKYRGHFQKMHTIF